MVLYANFDPAMFGTSFLFFFKFSFEQLGHCRQWPLFIMYYLRRQKISMSENRLRVYEQKPPWSGFRDNKNYSTS